MKNIMWYVFIALFFLLPSCAVLQSDKTDKKSSTTKVLQVDVIADNLPNVDNIYLSEEGVLYATLEHSAGRGELIRIINAKTERLLTQLNRPDGLVGKGRYLFLTEEVMAGRIIRYNLDTKEFTIISTEVKNPEGIDIINNGDLIVSEDIHDGRLLRIDKNGGLHVLLEALPRPEGLCVDNDGKIFVALTARGQIISYQKGLRQVVLKGLDKPDQIECAADGSLWITEDDKSGRLLRLHKGVLQTIKSGLSFPQGIAFHKDGSVYVAEQGKSRILRLSWH